MAKVQDGTGFARFAGTDTLRIDEVSFFDTGGQAAYAVSHLGKQAIRLPSKGTLSARLAVSLPANAVVDALEFLITARRADEAPAGDVGEVRGTSLSATVHEIIVDFGTVRTVSALGFSLSCLVLRVDAWNGSEFPATGTPAFASRSIPRAGDIPNEPFARFESERRTERLRISVASTGTLGALMDGLSVVLPDAPRDLAITLDGGPPVLLLPGAVQKGASATLSTADWNTGNQRIADLTAAFAARAGNPLDGTVRQHELLLTSREAGVLEIAEHRRALRFIRRATFATTPAFAPEAEGTALLPLTASGSPPGARAQSVSLTVSGRFGLERRVPPTGPDPAPGIEDPAAPLVSLDLTPERGAIFRLDLVPGLPAFTGLRLSLVAGPDGAEVRLVPWSNAGPGRMQPLGPLPDLSGPPVTLPAGAGGWQTHPFAAPLPIEAENLPWVAVLVTRGACATGLSAAGGGLPRVGPPSGPWRPLPALFSRPGFADLRFPFRAIGEAEDITLAPPVLLALAGAPGTVTGLDPAPKGARLTLPGPGGAAPALALTHFGAGELTLADIDIVFDT